MKTIFTIALLMVVTIPATAAFFQQDPKDTTRVESPAEPIGGLIAIQKKVIYPELAKRAGIEGIVYVEATVDVNGNVSSTKVIKGAHPALDKEAAEAVAKTKFAPARSRGKAVPISVTVPIRFRLDSKNKAQKHMLFQGNYEMGAGGGIAIPENANWRATSIEGRRVLLVLEEKWDAQGFWSVMSYLTKEEAKTLAEELRKAAEKIK
jgi:TonB family protein